MTDLVSLADIKLHLRLGDDTIEDALLTTMLRAAQRRCETHMGRKIDADPDHPLGEDDLILVGQAIRVLVGAWYRDRAGGDGDLPQPVLWLLQDLRVIAV
ncbi:head-tail connector protein [Sphingomonas oleivorans]|uniref:head-tail connector protein n=1 Tax=Sphingomonas oleivorans TaxID=1735121 RepID=UPI0013FD90D3|nr:head-tail connector protein [Sphingomonas oleivorans]